MKSGISIIIPAKNEERYIGRCLARIESLLSSQPVDYEVILVDNMSTDNTIEVASGFDIQTLSCNKGSPSAARNMGAQSAEYEILAFIDGDCLITPGWLDRILDAFSSADVGAYGGPALSPEDGNWIERSWSPTAIKDFVRSHSALPGANFTIRQDIFVDLSGFDESLITAEDDDFSRRVVAAGYKCISDSNHAVIHLGYPKSIFEIFKKQVWHSSSQIRAHGLFNDRMVILTALWAFSIPTLIIFSAAGLWLMAVLIFAFLCFAPALIAIKRHTITKNRSLLLFVRAYLIAWPFLMGRCVGLCKEIVLIAGKKWSR